MKPSVVVLMADNEEPIRHVLQVSFEDGGFEVILAAPGKKLWRRLMPKQMQ